MGVLNMVVKTLMGRAPRRSGTELTSPMPRVPPLIISGLLGLASLGGCAEGGSLSAVSDPGVGAELGKADVTVGPIQTLSCGVESSFVRRGSFARFSVEAFDQSGAQSRNYHLKVSPASGARVVQRDQVIFNLDGLYEVSCCSNDTSKCDQVAIRVGESTPALSVSIDSFSHQQALLSGHAVDRTGKAALVSVNGARVTSDDQGRFSLAMPTHTGLNRYEIKAVGSDGTQSLRRAWTLGGPFAEVSADEQSMARLHLAKAGYPIVSRVLTGLMLKYLDEYGSSPNFRQVQEGSSLGYSWEVIPKSTAVDASQVTLVPGRVDNELALHVEIDGFQVFADGRTRFGGGAWRARDVSVYADLSILVYFYVHADGFDIGDVEIDLGNLNLEISDMPGFFENVLEFFFKGNIQNQLIAVIKSVGDKGLNRILTGFEVREEVSLPAPLNTSLDMNGQVVELTSTDAGVTLGIGLVVDGETDPARRAAPGPVHTSGQAPELYRETPYELTLHLDLLNRIFFAAWQTGGLDFVHTIERPLGDEGLIGDQLLTIFATPDLPPVVSLGDREGELIIELGALKVDGVLESDLGAFNCALEVGSSLRALLSGGRDQLFVSAAVTSIEADVLIAPAGWELEATRRTLETVLAEEVIPEYAQLLSTLPVPRVDLSQFGLDNINQLSVHDTQVATQPYSISIAADLHLE